MARKGGRLRIRTLALSVFCKNLYTLQIWHRTSTLWIMLTCRGGISTNQPDPRLKNARLCHHGEVTASLAQRPQSYATLQKKGFNRSTHFVRNTKSICMSAFAASNDFHSVVYVFKISQYLLTASQSGKMQSLHFLFSFLYPSLSGYFIHLLPQSTVSQDLYSK